MLYLTEYKSREALKGFYVFLRILSSNSADNVHSAASAHIMGSVRGKIAKKKKTVNIIFF